MDHRLLIDHEFAVTQSGYVVRALLTLQGHAPDVASRAPLNLSIVLDRSGSMSGEPLAAAKAAAALLVKRLRPEDVVSVVAYDDEVLTGPSRPPAPSSRSSPLRCTRCDPAAALT